MKLLDKIDKKLDENFARGKSVKYLAGYLDRMADNIKGQLKTAVATGSYGTVVNNIVSSSLNDLKAMKQQLDKLAKTGKIGEAKYIPNMKYWPEEEIIDYKKAAEEFIQLAKISTDLPTLKRDVTASVGFHMRKNDKRKVKQLIDKHADEIIGGTGTVNQLIRWVKSK